MRYSMLGFILILAGNIYSQWVPASNGIIPNQRIYSIAAKGSEIFAVTSNLGVCLTTNNGNMWMGRNSNLNYVPEYVLFCGPYVFVGFSSENVLVKRSSSSGVSWESASNGLPLTELYLLYAKGEILFAGGVGGEGLFKSTNYGNNWIGISNGVNFQSPNAIISVYNNLYVAKGTNIYRSSNNGDNWVQVNNGLNNTVINSLVSSRSYLFAGTYNGVYLSTNFGDNWSQMNNGLNSLFISTMAASGNQVYAVNYRGIFLTTNYGITWVNKNSNIPDTNIISLCITGGNVFAGTNGSGVFISTNNGGNWSPVNNGMVNQDVDCLSLNSTRMFAGVWRVGLYYSTNGGDLWCKSNFSPQNINSIFSKDSIVYAGVDNGIYKSTNNGEDFIFSGFVDRSVMDIDECNNYLFAAVSGIGVYRSTDSGLNWTAVNSGITTFGVKTLITIGSSIYVGADSGRVFVSTNSGSNWFARNSGLPIKYIYEFTYNGSYMFAATAVGVYRSSNSGNSWTASSSGLPTSYVRNIISRGANIIAGSVDGIYKSSNNGNNWSKIDGINPYLYPKSILLTDNYLFSGINGKGILKRQLSEIIGIQNISTEIPSSYSLSQNYPNPFNPVTIIRFSIPAVDSRPDKPGYKETHLRGNDRVLLKVYDILGKEVQTLVNESLQPGTYETSFDGSSLTSGVYFYRLITNEFAETKKMLLIK